MQCNVIKSLRIFVWKTFIDCTLWYNCLTISATNIQILYGCSLQFLGGMPGPQLAPCCSVLVWGETWLINKLSWVTLEVIYEVKSRVLAPNLTQSCSFFFFVLTCTSQEVFVLQHNPSFTLSQMLNDFYIHLLIVSRAVLQ